ncbi:MAG: MFS transporter, partial [Candidatus Dormibacteraceae bacterium]
MLTTFQRAGRQPQGAFAIFGMLSGVAVLLGPTVVGVIVTHLGWRWIFYLNLPIGVAVAILAFVLVPDIRPGRKHRLDWVGVTLATAGLVAIVFGLIEGQRYSWGTITGWVSIPLVLSAGGVLLILFLGWQKLRQRAEPLISFRVFKDRNFTLMVLVLAVMGFCMVGIFLPLTLFYQSVLGLSAQAAGLVIGVQSLAMMVASPLAAMLAGRIGGKWLLVGGLVAFAAGTGYIDAVAKVGIDRWAFVPGLIVSGVGVGFVWTPIYTLATR